MLDSGHRFDLDEKTLSGFGCAERVRRDDFKGDFAIWFELSGPVDDAHPTVADFFKDFVFWDLRKI